MSKKWTNGIFKEEAYKKIGADYNIIGEYIDYKTRAEVENKCGYRYYIHPVEFLRKGLSTANLK